MSNPFNQVEYEKKLLETNAKYLDYLSEEKKKILKQMGEVILNRLIAVEMSCIESQEWCNTRIEELKRTYDWLENQEVETEKKVEGKL